MYYGMGRGGMMGHGHGGSGLLCAFIMAVVFVDLALLGVWLWLKIKQESKKCEAMCSHHHTCGLEGHKTEVSK